MNTICWVYLRRSKMFGRQGVPAPPHPFIPQNCAASLKELYMKVNKKSICRIYLYESK